MLDRDSADAPRDGGAARAVVRRTRAAEAVSFEEPAVLVQQLCLALLGRGQGCNEEVHREQTQKLQSGKSRDDHSKDLLPVIPFVSHGTQAGPVEAEVSIV